MTNAGTGKFLSHVMPLDEAIEHALDSDIVYWVEPTDEPITDVVPEGGVNPYRDRHMPQDTIAPNGVIQRWQRDHLHRLSDEKDCLFVEELLAAGLGRTHVASVLLVLSRVCKHCWDDDNDCQCWNDE